LSHLRESFPMSRKKLKLGGIQEHKRICCPDDTLEKMQILKLHWTSNGTLPFKKTSKRRSELNSDTGKKNPLKNHGLGNYFDVSEIRNVLPYEKSIVASDIWSERALESARYPLIETAVSNSIYSLLRKYRQHFFSWTRESTLLNIVLHPWCESSTDQSWYTQTE